MSSHIQEQEEQLQFTEQDRNVIYAQIERNYGKIHHSVKNNVAFKNAVLTYFIETNKSDPNPDALKSAKTTFKFFTYFITRDKPLTRTDILIYARKQRQGSMVQQLRNLANLPFEFTTDEQLFLGSSGFNFLTNKYSVTLHECLRYSKMNLIFFVAIHELMHVARNDFMFSDYAYSYVSDSMDRGKLMELCNIAQDLDINQRIVRSGDFLSDKEYKLIYAMMLFPQKYPGFEVGKDALYYIKKLLQESKNKKGFRDLLKKMSMEQGQSNSSEHQGDSDLDGQIDDLMKRIANEAMKNAPKDANGKPIDAAGARQMAKTFSQGQSKSMNDSMKEAGLGSSAVDSLLGELKKVKPINYTRILKAFMARVRAGDPKTDWQAPDPARMAAYVFNDICPYPYRKKGDSKKIMFAIDESGSMSDDEVVDAISAVYQGLEKYNLSGMLCAWDGEVNPDSLMVLDDDYKTKIKQVERKACGGTDPNCVLEFMAKENMLKDYSGIIFLTDGYFYGEDVKRLKQTAFDMKIKFMMLINNKENTESLAREHILTAYYERDN